ncbi:hypothetical protein EV644_10544 [Kribbella orskensis]|uniref:Uncharacterized protein n=1 Tax=Kribbella orskensis TaxID=2512216 RepID=A0ABY2BMS5_9ACTN|nr:hypothetical protein EV642_10444 [Kribbella sp. VKM Ac-2500]TCO24014.1 hypothetical protein EV644_10544 [Kribbella orskensis]
MAGGMGVALQALGGRALIHGASVTQTDPAWAGDPIS